MRNNSTKITDALLDIAAVKFYNKDFKDLDQSQKLYCSKRVLDFVNQSDILNMAAI
jgi:hypothetical protein